MKKILSLCLVLSLASTAAHVALAAPPPPRAAQAQGAPHLTNKDVTDMLKSGLSVDIVLAKIKSSSADFDTSAAALKELKTAGVPDSVILAMVQAPSGAATYAAPVPAPMTAAPAASPVGVEVIIPDGTQFTIVNMEEINSKTATEGDAVTFKVDQDVVVNHRVVIAKDTLVKGTVSDVEKSGRMGKGGKLGLRIEQTSTVDGQTVKLRASKGKEGGDKTGSVIALSLLISPLFLLKRGSNAKIKPGTKITVYTDEEKHVRSAVSAQ